MEGFLVINKSKDITSYACINHIKKLINKKEKIGHAGTLDPFATGLLIIGIGRNATKHLSVVMKTSKVYIATGKLGVLTDTLDKTGTITHEEDPPNITLKDLQKALDALCPSYMQTPPAYSALKYKGKPLYEYMREQNNNNLDLSKVLEGKAKKIDIYHAEILSLDLPYFTIKAEVSHGTYIRSLLNDIAQQCGTYTIIWELQRTKSGPISLEQATDLEQIKPVNNMQNNLISVDNFTKHFE